MSADSATDHHAQLFDAPRIQVAGVVHRGNFRRAFDLTINEPRTAIVGPNGVGKSTLLRLIAGLECLASGLLKIDGKVVDDADNETSFVPTHQRGVALAFQDHRLFPHLRVLDNVAYPLRRAGARRAVAREQAARVVEVVGLQTVALARPAQLSGGQRQRAAIARAIATPSEVLLLDEPLASVDEQSRAPLRELLMHTDHPTVLWVTHDPNDAKFADATLTIDPAA